MPAFNFSQWHGVLLCQQNVTSAYSHYIVTTCQYCIPTSLEYNTNNAVQYYKYYNLYYLPLYCFRSPDSGPLKKKMVYSSTKDAVQKKFVGVGIVFEAHDKSDLSYDEMAAEIEKKA